MYSRVSRTLPRTERAGRRTICSSAPSTDGVGVVFADDLVGAVLLDLLDERRWRAALRRAAQSVSFLKIGTAIVLTSAMRFGLIGPDRVAGAAAEDEGGKRKEEGESHAVGFGRVGSGVVGSVSGSGGSTAGPMLPGEVRSLGLAGAGFDFFLRHYDGRADVVRARGGIDLGLQLAALGGAGAGLGASRGRRAGRLRRRVA